MGMTPDRATFRGLSESANTIPIYREIAADLDTPVSAFLKLHRSGQGFLLESVEGGDRWGRYSVLGTDPFMTLRSRDRRLEVNLRDGSKRRLEGEPLDTLAEVLAPFKPAVVDGLSRFAGGFVGYLAYDLVRHIEVLPCDTADDLRVADLAGLVTDNFILFDNVTHSMKVVSLAMVEDRSEADAAYDRAVAQVEKTIEVLRNSPVIPPRHCASSFVAPVSNLAPGEYAEAVEKARRYIRAGDIIQVVLSQRYSQPLCSHPFSIYRALRAVNPSPYMFYLDLGGEVVVGASPEVMVKVEGRDVSVRPIAGTIRRGTTAQEDDALVARMLADPKEQAEHLMLLDLGRNDVGRVSDIGSVRVQMTVERYSHVNHIVSHVGGHLRADATRFDAFRATFPAGTLTGAPKVRAMAIIEELERTRRGIYGGAVGYIDFGVNLDTCIAIRTVLVKDQVTYLQVGAGIVADSVPEREQAECEAKARGIVVALERAAEMEKA
jgi:anthranilate synthase component 1